MNLPEGVLIYCLIANRDALAGESAKSVPVTCHGALTPRQRGARESLHVTPVAAPADAPPPQSPIASASMARSDESSLDPAQLSLACGRISGSARAIAEAHRFGVAEGSHQHPWTAAYMREAIVVYAAALPVTYQCDVASLFGHCADSMARQIIPASLAEDWLIVSAYLTNATSAILDRLEPVPAGGGESPGIDDHEPAVVHFDQLAALTTRGGALRLKRAAPTEAPRARSTTSRCDSCGRSPQERRSRT